ncbi:MAG: hypothetical protein ABH859_06345 [Pseudomonadota bacterium]
MLSGSKTYFPTMLYRPMVNQPGLETRSEFADSYIHDPALANSKLNSLIYGLGASGLVAGTLTLASSINPDIELQALSEMSRIVSILRSYPVQNLEFVLDEIRIVSQGEMANSHYFRSWARDVARYGNNVSPTQVVQSAQSIGLEIQRFLGFSRESSSLYAQIREVLNILRRNGPGAAGSGAAAREVVRNPVTRSWIIRAASAAWGAFSNLASRLGSSVRCPIILLPGTGAIIQQSLEDQNNPNLST